MSRKSFLAAVLLLVAVGVSLAPVAAYPRLTEFPAPFVQEGKIDYDLNGINEVAIIVGETAAAADVVGATLIGAKIGTHMYISHATYPPEPFELHEVDLNLTLYEYDWSHIVLANLVTFKWFAPVFDECWMGLVIPDAGEVVYDIDSIYLLWTAWTEGECEYAIWVGLYGQRIADPCICPYPYIEFLTYRLGCDGFITPWGGLGTMPDPLDPNTWAVYDFAALGYDHLQRYFGYTVYYGEVNFRFGMPEEVWIIGESHVLPWAFNYMLEVSAIHIDEDHFTNLTHPYHTVAFTLKDEAGNIVDCWIQNISQIYNVTFTKAFSCWATPVQLHIHVSKVCPDSNCAYVEVWSSPIPKHVPVMQIDGIDVIPFLYQDETTGHFISLLPLVDGDEVPVDYLFNEVTVGLFDGRIHLYYEPDYGAFMDNRGRYVDAGYSVPPNWFCCGDIGHLDALVGDDRYNGYYHGENSSTMWQWTKPYQVVDFPLVPGCVGIKQMTWSELLLNETIDIGGVTYKFMRFIIPADHPDNWCGVDYEQKGLYLMRSLSLPYMVMRQMAIFEFDFDVSLAGNWEGYATNYQNAIAYDMFLVSEYIELVNVVGKDVTGVFGGVFDRFNCEGEFTGTTKYDLTTMQDITPAEEKDSIFDGEDVFSYLKAPLVFVAGSPDAERAKSEKNLILIGGPIVNSYVKELNDTGLLPISFIGNDKLMDWNNQIWTLENVTGVYGWPPELVPRITSGLGVVQYAKENPWNPDKHILVVAGTDRFGTYAASVALADPTKIIRETAENWCKAGVETPFAAVIVLGVTPGVGVPGVQPPPGVVYVSVGTSPEQTPIAGG